MSGLGLIAWADLLVGNNNSLLIGHLMTGAPPKGWDKRRPCCRPAASVPAVVLTAVCGHSSAVLPIAMGLLGSRLPPRGHYQRALPQWWILPCRAQSSGAWPRDAAPPWWSRPAALMGVFNPPRTATPNVERRSLLSRIFRRRGKVHGSRKGPAGGSASQSGRIGGAGDGRQGNGASDLAPCLAAAASSSASISALRQMPP